MASLMTISQSVPGKWVKWLCVQHLLFFSSASAKTIWYCSSFLTVSATSCWAGSLQWVRQAKSIRFLGEVNVDVTDVWSPLKAVARIFLGLLLHYLTLFIAFPRDYSALPHNMLKLLWENAKYTGRFWQWLLEHSILRTWFQAILHFQGFESKQVSGLSNSSNVSCVDMINLLT